MTTDGMTQHISRTLATKAGRVLRVGLIAEADAYQQALITAQQWRAQHLDATEQCFTQVLACSSKFENSVATYRLKRLASIVAKVQRPEANFKLGELDDIGGCRLILETVEQVHQAADTLKARLTLKGSDGEKNYIVTPRESGYRSYHLLTNNETPEGSYHVEIQIRTKLQHYWSTAVEAAGEIYGTEYKSNARRQFQDSRTINMICGHNYVHSIAPSSYLTIYSKQPIVFCPSRPNRAAIKSFSCSSFQETIRISTSNRTGSDNYSTQ